MKISIIIPVYNSKKYLKDCVESVLNQSYGNLEVILVDDGSTDGSSEVCEHYKQYDQRVLVSHQENRGVSAARNNGISMASGDVITFVDADDTVELDMYEFLLSIMLKENADIVHCGYKHIVGDEVRLVHDTGNVVKQSSQEALSCLLGGKLFGGGVWNKLYRSDLLKGLIFREDIQIYEDILFNFEAFRHSKTSVFADYAMYNYIARKTTSACFVTPELKKISDKCEVNKYIYHETYATCNETVAADRYLRSLSSYFRYCKVRMKDVDMQERTAKEMWEVLKKTHGVCKNMRITTLMIHYLPCFYTCLYSVYDRLRKPNWEAHK